jgi:hypothetical protein
MGAAALQGVPVVTLDTDIWVNLGSRQYMRVMNLCLQDGATMLSKTVVELKDGHLVNFLYEVHGINGFAYEYGRAEKIKWVGLEIRVLPLRRILKSKQFILRDKDLAHIHLLEKTLGLQKQKKPATNARSVDSKFLSAMVSA